MPEITKGPPRDGRGPELSSAGDIVRRLAKAAFTDPGEWYSTELPAGRKPTSLHNLIYASIAPLVADKAIKDGRVWIRFHK